MPKIWVGRTTVNGEKKEGGLTEKKKTLRRQGGIIIVVMMQKASPSEKSCDGFYKIKNVA